jgi:riboflavin kinase/FMN adenylyltransferase
MKIFTELKHMPDIPPTAVALGNFDGVHLGHAELIRRSVALARECGLAPAVFTFSNHPCNVLGGKTLIRSVCTESDKEAILGALGVEYLFSFKFDEGFHAMSPETFISDLLLSTLNARAVSCGFNFRFGAEAAGGPDLLREAAASRGFGLVVMKPYRVDGTLVSSTAIRERVEGGDVAGAARLLGRPFSIKGEIMKGNGLGRNLGFPTANIALPDGLVVPAYGVYVTESRLGDGAEEPPPSGAFLRSVTNVGMRPTIGDEKLLAETHIFGAPDKNLYGRQIRVNFLSMLRRERRFSGLEELKAHVELDKRSALAFRP